MSGLTKLEWNYSGAGEILKMPGLEAVLVDYANDRCPDGCVVDSYLGTTRYNARITTDTEEAYQDNLENNTLAKAIGG